MKKVYTTIFLFVSLFFFSFSEVSAADKNYYIDSSFNDEIDNYLLIRPSIVKYAEDNNYCYISTLASDTQYSIYFFTYDSSINYTFSTSSNRFTLSVPHGLSFTNVSKGSTSLSDTNFGSVSSLTTRVTASDSYFNFSTFYDSNCSSIFKDHDNANYFTYSITYDDVVFDFDLDSTFMSFYEFYSKVHSDNSDDISSDHTEELIFLSSFYTLVIEKINLFATSILSNYIYLSSIGIFILIFTIALVRRLL